MSESRATAEERRRFEDCRAGGRWDLAERAAREALARHPDDAAFLALHHCALAMIGRYEEAFDAGERFIELGPAFFDLTTFWNPSLLPPILSERDKRLAALDELVARDARRPWALFYRAALSTGREIAPYITRAGRFPRERYGWMHAMLGRMRLSYCHFAEAIAHFKIAAQCKPVDWKTRAFLAEAYLCAGQRAKAFAEIDRSTSFASSDAETLQSMAWRGELRLFTGAYEEAESCLRRACGDDSPFAPCWLAGALLKSGRPREALRQLEIAETVHRDPEVWIWRGEALRELGRLEAAREALSRARPGLWPRFNRGLIFAALKDEDAMKAEFWDLPAHVRAYLFARTGRRPDRALSTAGMRELLEAGLILARGYRREDSHGNAIWMARAGS